MFCDRLWHPSDPNNGPLEDTPDEVVTLLPDSVFDSSEKHFLCRGDLVSHCRSSLELEALAVMYVKSNGPTQASPLKAILLALGDVAASRRRLEKLERDLLHASDSLHFNSSDLLKYKRDMSFINTLTPLITKANAHAGSASRISTELLQALQDYATVQLQGSLTQSISEVGPIGPLVTSLSRYMTLVEGAVNEAIESAERPEVVLEGLRGQIMRKTVIGCWAFLGLYVLFVIASIRSTKHVSQPTMAMLWILISIPLSLVGFLLIIVPLSLKEKSLRDELEEWALRDATLASLIRVQLILAHFTDCQNLTSITMAPERTQPSELACTPEGWEDVQKELQTILNSIRESESSGSRDGTEIALSTCV